MSCEHSVLIVGVGSIGERHLRCFGLTGRAKLAICEVNPELRSNVADRYSVKASFGDLTEALATRPKAVVICTPAHLHIQMATQAAKAGAHLLIEKPLSTSRDGIDELKAQIGNRNLKVSVAYVYRAHPVLASMREAVCSGRFGEALQVVAVFGQHFPFYRPAYRQTYYTKRSTGGGAIQDALTHVINAAEWICGPVTSVVADAAHKVLEGVDVEDTVNVLTRHGPVMGSFSLNQHQAPNEGTLTIVCKNGTARFEMHNCRWSWVTEPGAPWTHEHEATLERDTLFVNQANAFLDTIEGKREPSCTLEEAEQTLRVNAAILDSSSVRAWKEIPSAS